MFLRRQTKPKSITFIPSQKVVQTLLVTLKFDPAATIFERGTSLSDATGHWPFLDPPNTAVITNVRILDGLNWVQYLSHDEEDGTWQFHPPNCPPTMKEASVTSLQRILAIEPRIAELADLPLGWHAWRETEDAPWKQAPKREN